MIIRVNDPSCPTCDWYVSFNHAAGFNEDTLISNRNKVQLHTKAGTVSEYVETYWQDNLGAGSSYTANVNGHKVKVSVGAINTDEGWAEVTIGASTCKNNPGWTHTLNNGQVKKCDWVAFNSGSRCRRRGTVVTDNILASQACQEECTLDCNGTGCKNDPNWTHTVANGQVKKCAWVGF